MAFQERAGKATFFHRNKYNPKYNLLAMRPGQEQAKLEDGGKMVDLKYQNEKAIPGTLAPGFYEIRVRGLLDQTWSHWLEDLEVKLSGNGDMFLLGHIRDQAALMGILNKLHGLNLRIVSVGEIKPKK